jgi:hypothetical protein
MQDSKSICFHFIKTSWPIFDLLLTLPDNI